MFTIYVIVCSINALTCDMVMRDTAIAESFVTEIECNMAREAVAPDYVNFSPGVTTRVVCDDRDIHTILEAVSNGEFLA